VPGAPSLPKGTASSAGQDERAANWTRYWATGAMHSCVGSFGLGYGDAFSNWWRLRLAHCTPTQRLVDLATGGGPVPYLLAQWAAEHGRAMPEIVGVDLADVHFEWLHSLPPERASRIVVQAGVRIEALPFADASIHVACSHFGFEYADREAGLDELSRCLSTDGEVAMVMHHSASVIAEVAGHEGAHLDGLLAPGGAVDAAAGMLEPMARAATAQGRTALAGDAAALAAREAFNAAMRALQARAAASTVPDALYEAGEQANACLAIARQQGLAQARAAHGMWRQALEDAMLRQRELLGCALSPAAAEDLAAALRSRGFDARIAPLSDCRGRLLAWGLDARRAR